MSMPARRAAVQTDSPGCASTRFPSIVTFRWPLVPMPGSILARTGLALEFLREVLEGGQHRKGRQAAQRTEARHFHRVAEVAERLEILRSPAAVADLLEDLLRARRADAARRALA